MLASFIKNIEWLTISPAGNETAYPGHCARCYFDLSAYRDDLFSLAGFPMPEAITRSVPKRRAEYLAGRYLAQTVMSRLGVDSYVLTSAPDRSPQWPEGIAGSLSHNVDSVLCAAHQCSRDITCIGLDIETWMHAERASNLWPGIADEIEYDWLHSHDSMSFARMLTLNFSAKESLYKALYPKVKRYFDFLDVRMVGLDAVQHTFTLQLLTDLSADYLAGRSFSGSYLLRESDITTFLFN
ncbi:4'-phosphopantetheinyl transferase superfamily protein [Dickeya sp. CFBP 2040]|uniref:Enterobactin synthase component D n=1 Tax=Dickeya poaceiphila TaxID=568768 RepID=A0A5B8IDA2_9GAMM|nr:MULTISPECIES: 4'-phosphopantetheinyl transferase superfamily protein [Dickeya]NKI73654.1 4'-phosphopantetheinyl transferase superfamily protein [Dickeya sp. CFBP 2040]QDX31448.1 4'-phosphopantetheinyl transferase superfamily protein [Dickeya poaceiphila]